MSSNRTDKTKRKVVVPKINAFIYRVSKRDSELGKNKGIISPIWMREVSDIYNIQDRIKGIEHEQTALFGGVLDLNIATDPKNAIFDTLLPDDHVEIFYKDMADSAQKGKFLRVLPIEQYLGKPVLDTNLANITDPKFAGVSWKAEMIEKPSQVTTKIKAWDYHRMMQYMNIPRGQSGSTYLKYIDIDPFNKPAALDYGIKITRPTFDIRPNNHLLDYIDHTVNTYLKHGDEEDSVFMFPASPIYDSDTNTYSVQRMRNPLRLTAFTFGLKTGNDRDRNRLAVKLKYIWNDYPVLKTVMGDVSIARQESDEFNSTKVSDMLVKIEKHVSGQQTMCITRFMDAAVQISNGWTGAGVSAKQTGPVFRIVGEIVAIDQFALAHILAAGMTYDYGISEWFTPIVSFGTDFKAAMGSAIQSGTEGDQSFPVTTSRLVNVRWFAAKYKTENESRRSVAKRMKRIAVFNIDSYGGLLEYFSRAVNINLQGISTGMNKEIDSINNTDFINTPYFLSMALSSVNFPQKKSVDPYVFFWKEDDKDYMYQDITLKLATKNAIDLVGGAGEQFRELMTHHLRNVNEYSSLMTAAFSLDDKLVSFMTNIPSSYMRADIYTGSRFKTYAYDSLSIIRVIQILSSTMKGFPATNNPIHTGQQAVSEGTKEKVQKVDHYPIFLANRVVVKSKIIWVPDVLKTSAGAGRTAFKGSSIIQQVYAGYSSITAAKGSGMQRGRMFVVLDVDFKKQVFDQKEATFSIPIGDVNDLSMVKGSSISHMIHLSFGVDTQFLYIMDNVGLSRAHPSLRFNLGGRNNPQISPAQFSPLTLIDMTQNATYNSLLARSAANPTLSVIKDGDGGFPINNPGLGYIMLPNVDISGWYLGSYLISDFTTRTNNKVLGDAIQTDYNDNLADGEFQYLDKLISVSSYVNFSDLIGELKLLQKFSNPAKSTATYAQIENSDKALFDNIEVVAPYRLKKVIRVVGEKEYLSFKLEAVTDDTAMKLTEFLGIDDPSNDIHEFLELKEVDMAWLAPLRGYALEYDATAKRGAFQGKAFMEEISYSNNHPAFDDFTDIYLVITYLDLIVKGIRYLLWTISKSRFLGHVYMPMNYAGYTQEQPEDQRVEKDLEPGSSIVFNLEGGNVRSKSIATGMMPQLFGSAGRPLIYGQREHQLQAIQTVENGILERQPMIWYVSKKVVYIGEDSGAMMRLNMTEGSFDWTVFYREDTQMTRMSEYFLMNGMGNFFLGKRGQ